MRFSLLGLALLAVGCSKVAPVSDLPVTPTSLLSDVDPLVRLDSKPYSKEDPAWTKVKTALHDASKTESRPFRTASTAKSQTQAMEVLLAGLKEPGATTLNDAKALLAAKRPALDLLVRANEIPRWKIVTFDHDKVPNIAKEASIMFPEFASMKGLVKLEMLSARVNLESHQPEKAAQDYKQGSLTAAHFLAGDGNIITYLVGMACQSIVFRAIRVDSSHPAFRPEDLRQILSSLQKDPHDLANTFRVEYNSMMLRTIAGLDAGDPEWVAGAIGLDKEAYMKLVERNPKPFDRKKTVQLSSQITADLVRNATLPWSKQIDVTAELAKVTAGIPFYILENVGIADDTKPKLSEAQIHSGSLALEKVDNPAGRLMCGSLSFEMMMEAEVKREASLGATEIVLAAQIYKRNTGHFPAKLDDLVSAGILSAVPMDPFSGAGHAFRYNAARGVIWSIGPDRKDDGGMDAIEEVSQPKDFVWAVDGHAPPKKQF